MFDAFGVLNFGETLIEGVDRRLDELRALGCKIRVLTNAASYDRADTFAKFERLGISIESAEVITSRGAALAALKPGVWGGIAAPADRMSDVGSEIIRLGDVRADFDHVDGFLFFSSANWSEVRQRMLEASLGAHSRPVMIANADLAAVQGWRIVLVERDGLFAGHDVTTYCNRSGLFLDWHLNRI